MTLSAATPCLLLDAARLHRNVERLHAVLRGHGVPLRPHVKTAKCVPVIRQALAGQPGGITVSTLKEAEVFLEAGFRDMTYAVGIAPDRLEAIAGLCRRGAEVSVILDSEAAALAVAEAGLRLGTRFPALIEIDCDGHRSGIRPGDPALLRIGRILDAPGAALRGVLTHAGGSYACRDAAGLRAAAEQERRAVTGCAAELRSAGLPCPVVSVGSTPTAHFAESLQGVTEVRAGVFMFFDLVMAGLGVCRTGDIALSVLATVIGHQRDRGWVIVDAGWMALSRDRGTAGQPIDQGYGLVCGPDGQPLENLVVVDANQEHGVIARRGGGPIPADLLPYGSRVRILPSHACATAAQHGAYHVLGPDGRVAEVWPRFGGW